jgi:hypothetical protein
MTRKRTSIVAPAAMIVIAAIGCILSAAAADEPVAQYSVARIWDEAPHNAFTDLARFEGRFFCTFREGAGHVPAGPGTDGKIRVIVSEDASSWRSLALVEVKEVDLRDPKLSITPGGRLMLLAGGSRYDGGKLLGYSPWSALLDAQGRTFSEPMPIQLEEKVTTGRDWLWRVTWREGLAYGVVYQTRGDGSRIVLVKSSDGVHFEKVVDLEVDGQPNEATIRFRGDEMLVVVRREQANGIFGRSRPPYTSWSWQEMTHRLGGPDFLVLPAGELILGTRTFDGREASTVLGKLTENGRVEQLIKLPSGGDTSYPGLVVHNEGLYVSYYSSHEEKTAIYLAKIPLAMLLQ